MTLVLVICHSAENTNFFHKGLQCLSMGRVRVILVLFNIDAAHQEGIKEVGDRAIHNSNIASIHTSGCNVVCK